VRRGRQDGSWPALPRTDDGHEGNCYLAMHAEVLEERVMARASVAM